MIGINEIGLWAGITGVILAWFSSADEGLDLPKKWARHLFLADRTSSFALKPSGWVNGFSKMFDKVFGVNHLSFFCYKRTIAASLISVLGVALYVLLSSTEGTGFTNQFSPFTTIQFWVFAILINGTIDFISLLQTRFLISQMQKMSSIFLQILVLFVDIIFTLAVILICLHLFLYVLDPLYKNAVQYFNSVMQGGEKDYQGFVLHFHIMHLVQNILSVLSNGKAFLATNFGIDTSGAIYNKLLPGDGFNTSSVSSEIFFITTFITSIWLWFYAIAVASVKIVSASSPAMNIIRKIFRWRQRPMLSLGLISAALWTIMFWSWAFIVL